MSIADRTACLKGEPAVGEALHHQLLELGNALRLPDLVGQTDKRVIYADSVLAVGLYQI